MRAICGVIAGLISFQCLAYSSINLVEDPDTSRDLNLHGFGYVEAYNFSDTGNGSSLINISKEDRSTSNSLAYGAYIEVMSDGPEVAFITQEKCREGNSHYTTINVNDQNVRAESSCGRDIANTLVNVYFAKNKAGRDYIIRQFKDKNVVFIRFRERVIPFDATGFREAWDEFGGKAL